MFNEILFAAFLCVLVLTRIGLKRERTDKNLEQKGKVYIFQPESWKA